MSRVIVRAADLEADALSIHEGAKNFISRMDYTDFLPDTEEGLTEAVGFILTLPGFECWVAEHDGEIVGGIGVIFGPPLWNRRIMGMVEMFIWAAPDAPKTVFLKLLNKAEDRRREMGATYREYIRLTSSPPGLERIYTRMGLRKVQDSWIGVD